MIGLSCLGFYQSRICQCIPKIGLISLDSNRIRLCQKNVYLFNHSELDHQDQQISPDFEIKHCIPAKKKKILIFFWVFIDNLLTVQYRAGSDCVGGISNLDHRGEP
jgi:hypothetical protein